MKINSDWNKYDLLCDKNKGKKDIFMIPETKIDDSFPIGNFLMYGFSTSFWSGRDTSGGAPLEQLCFELNLRNTFYFCF